MASALRQGILPVLQTPFTAGGDLDRTSLGRLVRDAVAAGADGLLAPVVASEVDWLSDDEREAVARTVAEVNRGAVPWVLGASAPDVDRIHRHAALARELGASAYLVAVPQAFYGRPEDIVPFFRAVAAGNDTPLLVQDYQAHGPGMDIGVIRTLREEIPTLVGLKIETVPAGPKYTAVRHTCGAEFFVCGGWAAPQMIEALDRGVDAMIPESSMVRVYKAVDRAYREGDRERAREIFRRILPVLAYANQDLATSIAFFKRLLKRRGIFESDATRVPFPWDDWNRRIADDLIDLALEVSDTV